MTGILIFVACVVAVFAIIAAHEYGHYLAGAIGGIPWDVMEVRLFEFPQHVALRRKGRWLHPQRDYDGYVTTSLLFLRSRIHAGFYVAGGLLIQTLAFVALVAGLAVAGTPRLILTPLVWALVSVPGLYLISDLLSTRSKRKPCGDFSFLWVISPVASAFLALFVVGAHGGVLLYVLTKA